MITMPRFWRRGGSRWPALLLAPLGWLYGAATCAWLARPGWRAPVPVISVGNFTLGGAGKTPTAISLAALLKARGETPYILSRGHGGRQKGPVRVDSTRHTARDVGDEPLLMARHAPVIVAGDRAAGARLAVELGANVLILDDSLQNPHLVKDLSLALIDGTFGLGNGHVVPAGPLRAPVAAMLPYVDALLLVGEDRAGMTEAFRGTKPMIGAVLRPMSGIDLKGKRVLAFCGIALPEKFEATLRGLGAEIVTRRDFADHHVFSENEAADILALAARLDALPVTTEKDHVRLTGGTSREKLAAAAWVVPIRLEAEPMLETLVIQALETARRR
jgi:tetraacyldisaccharide 4'-kinase